MRNTPSSDNSSSSPKPRKPNRRRFMKNAGGILLGTLIGSNITSDEKLSPSPQKSAENINPQTVPEAKEQEKKGLSKLLDNATALGVFAPFAYEVFFKGAFKGASLDYSSVTKVNGAAAARIGALNLLGGEEGRELAKEEMHEILHGLLPVPALLLLSDATTSQLKVEAEEIFKKVQKDILAQPEEKTIQRPAHHASPQEWQEYLEKINHNLVEKVAQTTGLCAVFAPLGTTYTSSALANKLKVDVARILYEQSYAYAVLEGRKKYGDKSTPAMAQAKAIERTNTLFNGPSGFSNLIVTLAANAQGTWGIGDPPELYYMANHLFKRPLRVINAQGYGVANAQFLTMSLNMAWLKQTGVFDQRYVKEYWKAQGKTLGALWEAGTNADMRSVSVNDGRRFARSLEKTLEKEAKKNGGTVAKEALELLRKIPKAKLQFSWREYLSSKVDIAKRWVDKDPEDFPQDEIFATMESFAESDFITKLHDQFSARAEGDSPMDGKEILTHMAKSLEKAQEKIQGAKASGLARLLEELAQNKEAYMFGEKVLSKFFKDAYGENILEEKPELLDMISISALKVAENAGSLSKIGNGANLSQKKLTAVADSDSPQGVKFVESEVEMKDTILAKNRFATAANLLSITTYSLLVMNKMPPIEPVGDGKQSKSAELIEQKAA